MSRFQPAGGTLWVHRHHSHMNFWAEFYPGTREYEVAMEQSGVITRERFKAERLPWHGEVHMSDMDAILTIADELAQRRK